MVRAVAIAMVVFSHVSLFFPNCNNIFTNGMQIIGVLGVEIFFVLSGFLIGGILLRLLRSTNFSSRVILGFWVRRWFRTLPLYFLVLLLNILLVVFLGDTFPESLWKYFLFLQNFSYEYLPFFPESWSLSIEEFAYLLGPIVLFILYGFFKNTRLKNELVFLVTSYLLVVVFLLLKMYYHVSNLAMEQSLVYWNSNLKALVIYRLDAVFTGFILVYYFEKHSNWIKKNKIRLFVIGFLMCLLTVVVLPLAGLRIEKFPFYWNVLYLPINSLAVCLTLPFFYFLKRPNKVLNKFIENLSLYSYAIYLLHYSFMFYVIGCFWDIQKLTTLQSFFMAFLYLIMTYFLSKTVYLYYEKPIMDLRDSGLIKRIFRKQVVK